MIDLIKKAFDFRVQIKKDEISGKYEVISRSQTIFYGTKVECEEFAKAHAFAPLVRK